MSKLTDTERDRAVRVAQWIHDRNVTEIILTLNTKDMRPLNPAPQWQSAIDEWLSFLQMRGLSDKTVRLRSSHVRYVASHCGVSSPDRMTRRDLRSVLASPKWSPEYRRSIRASVRSFFDFCVTNGLIAENVSDCIPEVKQPPPRPRPVTDAVWDELIASGNERVRLMSRLAGEAGLRRAEVAALHTDDLARDSDGYVLIIRGKGDKQRVVPISDDLADALRAIEPGFVFAAPNDKSRHLSAQYVGTLVSAQMPAGWSMHKLRHRYATRGYAGTGNLRAVQEALGHASVATTQRYTAVSSRDVRAVSNAASIADLRKEME